MFSHCSYFKLFQSITIIPFVTFQITPITIPLSSTLLPHSRVLIISKGVNNSCQTRNNSLSIIYLQLFLSLSFFPKLSSLSHYSQRCQHPLPQPHQQLFYHCKFSIIPITSSFLPQQSYDVHVIPRDIKSLAPPTTTLPLLVSILQTILVSLQTYHCYTLFPNNMLSNSSHR